MDKGGQIEKEQQRGLNLHFDSNPSSPAPCERGNGSGGGDHSHIIEVSPADLKKRLISISRTCFAWPDLRCIIEAMEEEHGDVDNFILSLQQCRSTLNKVNSKEMQPESG